jgi:hypothetical protein
MLVEEVTRDSERAGTHACANAQAKRAQRQREKLKKKAS